MLHTSSPWACFIKVCSNGAATYIILQIIAKDKLNIANLKQTFEKLLDRILGVLYPSSPWICVIKVLMAAPLSLLAT